MSTEAWIRPPMDAGMAVKARWVSRPLSLPMEELAAIMASHGDDIMTDKRGGFCENTHKNFVGSLLIAANQGQFMDVYRQMEVTSDLTVTKPMEIIAHVPLFVWDEHQKKYEAVGETAGPVMVKHACGREVGVVLEGPFAGLMLRAKGVRDIYDYAKCGMCTNRIFNDDRAKNHYPYIANFPLYLINRKANKTQMDKYLKLDDMFIKLMLGYYEQNVTGDDVYLIDLFFSLCRDLDIPVDADNFHYTRHIGRILPNFGEEGRF